MIKKRRRPAPVLSLLQIFFSNLGEGQQYRETRVFEVRDSAVGERKQTNYQENRDKHFAEETFEISIRNHKKKAVEVRVVEHLYRWSNWEIKGNSDSFEKIDSSTIQFKVDVKPDKEKKITYTAHYTW